MKILNKVLLLTAMSFSVVTGTQAKAFTPGFTIGAGFGYNDTVLDTGKLQTTNRLYSDEDMHGMVGKLFTEYNFTKSITFGLGYNYFDQGKLKEISPAGNYDYKFVTHTLETYAKFNIPVTESFDLFTKLGPTLNIARMHLSDGTKNETGIGLVIGFGAEYRFTDNLGIRAGIDLYARTIKSVANRYKAGSETSGHTADAYLAAVYRF